MVTFSDRSGDGDAGLRRRAGDQWTTHSNQQTAARASSVLSPLTAGVLGAQLRQQLGLFGLPLGGQRRDLRRVVVLSLLRPVLIIYVEISFTHEPLECVAEWPTSALDEFVDELA